MHTRIGRLRLAVVVALALAMSLSALVATAPASRADHDTVGWSMPFYVSTTGNDEGFSSVLTDGAGTFYVFYLNTDTGTGLTDVYASKWASRSDSGQPERIQPDVLVNDVVGDVATSSPFLGFPQVPRGAIDHSGNLYVAWTSTAFDVFVSKSIDAGATWLPAVKANSATATAWDFDASIAITGTGASEKIWVAWSQLLVGPGWFLGNVTVSHSDNQGSTFIGYTNASGQGGAGTTLIIAPDLAVDSLGRLYLTYTAIDISVFQLYANFTWSDNGATWSSPWTFSTPAGGFLPVVTVDAKDRVHVGWLDDTRTPTGGPTVYYMRSTTRGASWTTKWPIDQGSSGPGGNSAPSLVVHGDTVIFAWDGQSFTRGLGYAISADGGDLWYPGGFYQPGFPITNPDLAADENGTFYATWTTNNGADLDAGFSFWDGPPSRPVITSIARGTGSLSVRWSAVPEPDVSVYRVWRSFDGSSYELVASVPAGETVYLDSGLANGTYWYAVTAVDLRGTSSHPSVALSATVGMTTQEMIDALNAEIASLQAQLAASNASLSSELAAAQAQITSLQAQLTALQNSQASNNAAVRQQLDNLQANLTSLQNQLNQARAEAATQTMSYVNLGFEILVVVLLALILVMQMRRPKSPQMMMAQPSAVQKKPDDEL
ncbi:MAG TPA: hypothetical protein VI999_08160 [Thermoplasmata archaeon]|nr:hypothetical protein [Thermoplasmata archaeon]